MMALIHVVKMSITPIHPSHETSLRPRIDFGAFRGGFEGEAPTPWGKSYRHERK